MCRTGTNVHHCLVADTHHGTACAAQDTHIQGTDVSVMSSDLGIVNTRTAVLDHTDVGSGSAHLKVDCIGSTQIHQGTHNGSSRS